MARNDFGFQIGSALGSQYLTDAKLIKAGYVSVSNIAERDSLRINTTGDNGVIVNGSLVYVVSEDKFYMYNGTSWIEKMYAKATIDELLAQEKQERESDVTQLDEKIDDETEARTSADTTLQENIDSEASTRASADSTLTTNLSNEISRATSAEQTNTTNISNEVTRSTNKDNELDAKIGYNELIITIAQFESDKIKDLTPEQKTVLKNSFRIKLSVLTYPQFYWFLNRQYEGNGVVAYHSVPLMDPNGDEHEAIPSKVYTYVEASNVVRISLNTLEASNFTNVE